MHPSVHAVRAGDTLAYIMAESGEGVTYRQLEERSNQAASLFRSLGLERSSTIAIMLENDPRFFDIVWAAQRAGLYYTCISTKLTAQEIVYILHDCGTTLLLASASLGETATDIAREIPTLRIFSVGGQIPGVPDYESACHNHSTLPITDESCGSDFLYSSGTTGRPKGIRPSLPVGPLSQETLLTRLGRELYRMNEKTMFLSPAPLYHAAPLRWCMTVQRLGGTVVLMQRFSAEFCLELIARHAITHAQWVPTHFVRMLKLPDADRQRYSHSSLVAVFHAAAPCPIPIKRAMITWWGPIVHEYYSATEFPGFTAINAEEWLAHPGSVGRAVVGDVFICDELGEPLPPRKEGLVYFGNGPPFVYHNDPVKTAEVKNKYGWVTLGDIGWLDEDGYLYLTDRRSFMIITGGVNVYPQEIENLLVSHPEIADAAVFGIPNEEMGEIVVAVVQLVSNRDAGTVTDGSLREWLRCRLSRLKIPKIIHFQNELPRHPNGKLYKKQLQQAYMDRQRNGHRDRTNSV